MLNFLPPTWRKVAADLFGAPARTALVVASVAIGLFAIGVIASMYVVLNGDLEAGYLSIQPANVFFVTTAYGPDLVQSVERLPGVAAAEAACYTSLRAAVGGRSDEWVELTTVGRDWQAASLNTPIVREGRWPPQKGEIALDQSKFANVETPLGGELLIELPSGAITHLTITSIIQDMTIGAAGGGTASFFTSALHGYVDLRTLDGLEVDARRPFNNLFVQYAGDSRQRPELEALGASVRDQLERANLVVLSESYRSSYNHPNSTLVKAMSGILVLLGLLVVFLSSFLVFNTLQALMDAQMTQIGILKTVGANRAQVVIIYVRYIFVIGVVAFVLAAPTANVAAFWLSEWLGDLINLMILGRRALPGVGVLQLGLALIIPQAAALLPIVSGAKLPVQAALSGLRNVGTVRRGTLDRLIGGIGRLTRPQRLALRNVYRRRGRLILTLVTLTLGGAVFIGTFNVRVSLLQYVDRITQYFQADVNISLRRAIRLEEMDRLLADIPGVAAVEGWSAAQTEIILPGDVVGDRVQLIAPPADTPLITPILLQGRWLTPGDQNALVVNEQFLFEFPDLHPGDPMRLRVNGRDIDFEVVGVFQMAGNISGFIAYANYPFLSAQIGQSGRASLFRVSATDAPLTPQAQLALARRIEARLRAENLPLIVVDTGENLNKMAVLGFNAIAAFLLFMAVLTALVGSIGLTGTMSLNVMERTREIGVLRAIGADNPTLIQMVMIEGMTIGLVSWVLAAVLAIPIGKVLGDSINLAIFSAPSILAFTPVGYVIWLVASLLLAAAASYLPARSAARLTIREVLAYE